MMNGDYLIVAQAGTEVVVLIKVISQKDNSSEKIVNVFTRVDSIYISISMTFQSTWNVIFLLNDNTITQDLSL